MRQSVSGREGERVETQCEGVYVLGAIKSGSQCMPSRATIHVRGHQAQQTAHTQPLPTYLPTPTPTPSSCSLPAASLSLPHRVVFCLINFAYALHASGRQGRWVQRGGGEVVVDWTGCPSCCVGSSHSRSSIATPGARLLNFNCGFTMNLKSPPLSSSPAANIVSLY